MQGTSTRPAADEYAPDFERYIRLVPAGDVVEILAKQLARLQAVLQPLSDAESLAVHPPYSWTLKQVLGHVTDGERVFGYRRCGWLGRTRLRCPGLMRCISCSLL